MIADRVDEAREEIASLDQRIKQLRLDETFARREQDIAKATRLAIVRTSLQERHQAARLVVCRGG